MLRSSSSPRSSDDRRRARQHALVDLERQVELRGELAQLLERLEQPRPQKLRWMGVEEDRGQVAALRGQLDRLAPEQPAQVPLAPDVLGDAAAARAGPRRAAGECCGRAPRRPRPSRGRAARSAGRPIVTWFSRSSSRSSRVPVARRCDRSGCLTATVVECPDGPLSGFDSLRSERPTPELEVGEVDDVAFDERRVLRPARG